MKRYVINRIDGKVASIQSVKSLLEKTYNGKQITEETIEERMQEINDKNGAVRYEYWNIPDDKEDVMDFLLGEGDCKIAKNISDLCDCLRDYAGEMQELKFAVEDANEGLVRPRALIREKSYDLQKLIENED